jgi:hypothetical protein
MPATPSLFFHGPLLRADVLGQVRVDQLSNPIPNEAAVLAEIKGWVDALGVNRALGEAALEQRFNQAVFCSALSYTMYPQPGGATATIWAKPPASETHLSGAPDAVLGSFGSTGSQFLAVVELKTIGTNLDAPQARVPPLTPVQQAFEYAQGLAASGGWSFRT